MGPVTVISNDCWGGDLYQHLGGRYGSPFVGLFVHGPCYVTVLEHLDTVLHDDVRVIHRSRYVDGDPGYPVLEFRNVDAELHMLHYPTAQEARETWQRRSDRVAGPVRVKASIGRDHFTDDHISRVYDLCPSALVLGPPTARDDRIVKCSVFTPTLNFLASLREFDLPTWLAEGRVVRPPRTDLADA